MTWLMVCEYLIIGEVTVTQQEIPDARRGLGRGEHGRCQIMKPALARGNLRRGTRNEE
jgi:hypothetical protein